MLKLDCKLKNFCPSQDKQTLESCYMCRNLITTSDLVLDTVDKSVKEQKEELIKLPKITKIEGTDLVDINGEKIIVKAVHNDLEKTILRNKTLTELNSIKDPTKAARFNEGKPQWSYVHFKSLEPMVRVLEFGAIKYAPKNWMKPMDTMKILESMQRHLAALFDGEECDSETGISHMGHIQCNAMFYNYHKEKENDSKS